ncbi:MAG: hypothetical protein ABI580_08070 [Burkholderiaceae bacterium]
MFALVVAVLCLFAATATVAGEVPKTVQELNQSGGSQLSALETRKLLAGAFVLTTPQSNRTITYEHAADGELWVVVRGQFIPDYRKRGDWRVKDEGAYCVKVLWPMGPEDWCQYVFKLGDQYYLSGRKGDKAILKPFNIRK